MHPYSINRNRWYVPLIAGILGLLSYQALLRITPPTLQLTFPLVEVLSPLALAVAIFIAYDKWLWRLASAWGVDPTPNLRGVWEGQGVSSHPDEDGEYNSQPANSQAIDHQDTESDGGPFECHLTIKQSWSRMLLDARFEASKSSSKTAGFIEGETSQPVLVYEYINEPHPRSVETMHTHRGIARLEVKADGVLEGFYFTGPERKSYGELRFERVE